ncbi:MAG: glycosyltransferase [Sulfuricaulis sp.]|uniref:glycosyltransferase family 4 protein n=1 Tax=Sulfuricaulis sp. TaxID=2003553 RepID=UPI0025F77B3D|nr:glycosyltransferase [Sulfuricaulis sp.]MCR4348016.1 glycosyltransferase [Sulfuricaulis sp.]
MRTIANMVERLGDEFDFRIVTTDRDIDDAQAYGGVQVDRWNRVGNAQVYYASPGSRSLRRISQIMQQTPHDVQYLNSFFDPVFTFKPLLARYLGWAPASALVIAPRGEFSVGALEIKRWKKAAYIAVMRKLGLCREAIWQASSELEVADIMLVMNPLNQRGEMVVAADIVGEAATGESGDLEVPVQIAFNPSEGLQGAVHRNNREFRSAGEPLRLCFLSRISPKKNLDYALRVLAQVRVPIRFSIYGPQEEPAYWAECQRLIAALPAHVEATYCGSVEHQHVVAIFTQHDLFFFPTRGENFGHVIYEALCAGTPVLLSDQTPWRDLEQHGVGWALPLGDPSAFVRVIEDVADWNSESTRVTLVRATAYAKRVGSDVDVMESNRRLFRRQMTHGAPLQ